jgi:hypothetical protein
VIISNGGPFANGLKVNLADCGRFEARVCETVDGITPALLAQKEVSGQQPSPNHRVS